MLANVNNAVEFGETIPRKKREHAAVRSRLGAAKSAIARKLESGITHRR